MPLVLVPPTLDRPGLPAQLAALGRTRRRVAVAAGVYALIAVAGGGVTLACGLDAALHLSPLARAFALVLVLAATGVVWLRGVASAVRLPTRPMALAVELEGRYGRLNDSLASAVAFLADRDRGDDRGVSRRLRAAAVRKAERLVERLDIGQIVPSGRAWKWFWAASAVVLVAAPLAALKADRAATALVRLADPFGQHPWPAKTRLTIQSPEAFPVRLPKGDPFDLRFVVAGELPDRATVAVRVDGGDEWEDGYPLTADPKAGTAAVAARLDPARLTHDFAVRVTANDADSGWLKVAVVPPPRLVPLGGRPSPQVYAVPPAYTGLAPGELPDGAAVVEVPQGTTLSLRAAADVRLVRAELVYQGDRSAIDPLVGLAGLAHPHPFGAVGGRLLAGDILRDTPLTLGPDGKVMTVTVTPSAAGVYALRMTDETGIVGSRLIEFRLIPDPAPAVSLLRPAAGRDPLLVVPTARVPVHVSAEDKVYGVRRTFLEYRVGKDGALKTVPLADLRAAADPLAAVAGGAAAALKPSPVRSEALASFPVAGFLRDDGTPVQDGDMVILRGAADDSDDVSVLKEPGRSPEVELHVASVGAVEAVLQKQSAGLRPELIRAREAQRDAREKAAGVTPRPDGTLSPQDRDALQAAEAAQRQVRGRVADARDGLRAKVDLLRETARANGLPRSPTTDKLEAAAEELGRLADRELAAADPKLGDARQQAAQPAKPGEEGAVQNLLTQAGRHQKAVEEGLTGVLDLFARWGDAAEIRGEARVQRDAALRGAAAADQLRDKVPPGKPAEGLTPEERAEIERAAARADGMADNANKLIERAGRMAAEKEAQAKADRAAAAAKEQQTAAAEAQAAAQPAGSAGRQQADAKAAGLKAEAAEAKAASERAAAEANALREAVAAAGGQALPNDLRQAGDAARANRQADAADRQRSAADRLDKLAAKLAERPDDTVPELAKKKREQEADDADAIVQAQDELRRRTEAANRTPDPAQLAEQLKRLAPEQEKLAERTKDLAQQLTRDRDPAARDARAAQEKMEAARDDLERGADPGRSQEEAADLLDRAREQLDTAPQQSARELTDEKRRKLADAVKALRDRHAALVAEADRLHQKVLTEKAWSRPTLASYGDLEDAERALAVEVRALADQQFAELPVFKRVVTDAAGGMEKAADRAKARARDALDADPDSPFDADLEKANGDKVRRPMDLALRRLDQLLDALKPDPPKKKDDGGQQAGGMPPGGDMPPDGGGDDNADVLPPLAQLKALRALQADLNRQTAEFDTAHPDRAALTDEERDELKELEAAQADITALFEVIAKLFKDKPPADDAPPEEEKP